MKDDPYKPVFGTPITGWYRWFAWRPVNTLDRGWRWLVPIYKRRCQVKLHLSNGGMKWFQHVVRPHR